MSEEECHEEGRKEELYGNCFVSRTDVYKRQLVGNAILAFTVVAFIVPHGVIMGGATGIGLTIAHYEMCIRDRCSRYKGGNSDSNDCHGLLGKSGAQDLL